MEKTETTTKCPYCDGEIAEGVTKCKHCEEWLKKKPSTETQNNSSKKKKQEDDEPLGIGGRMFASLILSGIGWALFYFGSWHLILGKKIDVFLQYFATGQLELQNIIVERDGFVFRVNEKYYGFMRDVHFFDSPVIQWIMLLLSLGAFVWAIQMLFTGNFGSDD